MAFCDNCGMELAENAKFCENCGAPRMQAISESVSEREQMTQEAGFAGSQQTTQSTSYDQGASFSSSAAYSAGSTGMYAKDPVPAPSFVEAVKTCFTKYATFSGRARRSEYWYFTLFTILCQLILGIVGNIIFGAPENGGSNILQSLFSLAVLVPSLAVFWRRMHDIDKSGLWFFLNLIPLIGQIVLIVFEATDGHPGENRFGMSPKYPD
jgi:uncharacterized membrane protein YhaH (DUF805 family)